MRQRSIVLICTGLSHCLTPGKPSSPSIRLSPCPFAPGILGDELVIGERFQVAVEGGTGDTELGFGEVEQVASTDGERFREEGEELCRAILTRIR